MSNIKINHVVIIIKEGNKVKEAAELNLKK